MNASKLKPASTLKPTATVSALAIAALIGWSTWAEAGRDRTVPPRQGMVVGQYGTAQLRAWNFYCKEVHGPRILRVIVNHPNAPQTTDPNAFHMYLQPDGIAPLDEPFLERIVRRCTDNMGAEAGITGMNEVEVDWRR